MAHGIRVAIEATGPFLETRHGNVRPDYSTEPASTILWFRGVRANSGAMLVSALFGGIGIHPCLRLDFC